MEDAMGDLGDDFANAFEDAMNELGDMDDAASYLSMTAYAFAAAAIIVA